jgi:hypothetical protein
MCSPTLNAKTRLGWGNRLRLAWVVSHVPEAGCFGFAQGSLLDAPVPTSQRRDLHPTDKDPSVGTPDVGHPNSWWVCFWKSNRRSFDFVWPEYGPNVAQDDQMFLVRLLEARD